ncbi:heterokaryon incompatibility protein-domain-containing protein [Cladorrhinum sp. PSN259]|nr:heterokaryon incompatibility protein-domain-containing protein [Cladorrhinum sp. PSN259]
MVETKLPTNDLCQRCKDFQQQLSGDKTSYTITGILTLRYGELKESASAGCAACLIVKDSIPKITSGWKDLTDDTSIGISVGPPLEWRSLGPERRPGLRIRVGHQSDLFGWEMMGNNCSGVDIQLFSPPGSTTSWGPLGWQTCREVDPDSSSTTCMNLAKSWFDECITSHKFCRQGPQEVLPPPTILPTRVIDVGSDDAEPRLCLPQGKTGTWVALSHCWGGFRPLTTETRTLKERLQRISLVEMPKTFRDAVTLTRFLGIRYLWIDSLCIIQDDLEDWEVESSRMAAIYANAALTIAAGGAADARQGFLGPRDESANTSFTIPCRMVDGDLGYVHARTAPRDSESTQAHPVHSRFLHFSQQPLDSRGWAFQERYLSRRVLTYAAAEMAFLCRLGSQCECSPVVDKETWKSLLWTRPARADMILPQGEQWPEEWSCPPGHTPLPIRLWLKMVENYTWRLLTRDSDRLPALSGVAATISREGGADYICGLWKPSFIAQLAWQKSPWARSSRHAEYHAPTWSWASVNCEVEYRHELSSSSDTSLFAEILSIDIRTLTANPYGPASGSVKLGGAVSAATCTYQGLDSTGSTACHVVSIHHEGSSHEVFCVMDVDTPDGEVEKGQEVSLFAIHWMVMPKHSKSSPFLPPAFPSQIFPHICLVLKKTGDKYSRVGIARLDRRPGHGAFKMGEVEII